MNAIDSFQALLVGVGTLPVAAGIAWCALKAIVACLCEPPLTSEPR
jgi:hypothetical protein